MAYTKEAAQRLREKGWNVEDPSKEFKKIVPKREYQRLHHRIPGIPTRMINALYRENVNNLSDLIHHCHTHENENAGYGIECLTRLHGIGNKSIEKMRSALEDASVSPHIFSQK